MVEFVPCAAFRPDEPQLLGTGASICLNAIPTQAQQNGIVYSSFNELGTFSTPLSGVALGAIAAEKNNGDVVVYVGTVSALYSFNGNSFDIFSPETFSTTGTNTWHFTNFGGTIIGTNYTNEIQKLVIDVDSSFSNLSSSTSRPRAKYIATVRDFLVTANTVDSVNNTQPTGVRWSAIGDPTDFPIPGSIDAQQKQSDFQILKGNFGEITGLVPGVNTTADAFIFFERAIFRMRYVGGANIFAFEQAINDRGCIAPKSLINVGSLTFFLSETGWCSFDGVSVTQIGFNKIDNWFKSRYIRSQNYKIQSAIDYDRKTVLFSYPTDDESYNSEILVYNWEIGEWSYIQMSTSLIFSSRTRRQTTDSLGSTLVDTFVGFVDDPSYLAQFQRIAAFDTLNRYAFFSGNTLQPIVETIQFQTGMIRRSIVREARLVWDGLTEQKPEIQPATRNSQGEMFTFSNWVPLNAHDIAPLRQQAQYHKFRIRMPENTNYRFIQGVELDMVAGHKR